MNDGLDEKQSTSEPDLSSARTRKWLRRGIAASFLGFLLALMLALGLVFLGGVARDSLLSKVLVDHFAAIVGLPTAALMAFAVVWTWRTTDGPVEIDAWGMKFKGASGPILMWVLVFSVLAAGLKAVW